MRIGIKYKVIITLNLFYEIDPARIWFYKQTRDVPLSFLIFVNINEKRILNSESAKVK